MVYLSDSNFKWISVGDGSCIGDKVCIDPDRHIGDARISN